MRADEPELEIADGGEFEAVWPVRLFENFLEDCRTHLGANEVNV